MRIAVIEPNGSGALAHFAYQLCAGMAEAGAEVTLVTSQHYELARLPHDFRLEPRMRLWPLTEAKPTGLTKGWRRVLRKARRVGRGAVLVREWLKLTLFLQRERPDVVQFGEIHFPFLALFLWWLRYRRLYLSQICHEFEHRDELPARSGTLLQRLSQTLSRRFAGWAFAGFSDIFFLSERTRHAFLRRYPAPSATLHTVRMGNQGIFALCRDRGGGFRQRHALRPDDRVILFIGGIRPSKGLPDLLQAFAALAPGADVKLLIAGYPGKTSDLQDLQSLTAKLGITPQVIFDARYIPMEEVGNLVERAAMVVYPYRSATQSGSLQLAYTFGRPVIATDVGGLGEDVEPGETGLLVPPRSPAALAEAMRRLLDDPALARRMGENARRLSETRHAWRTIAEDILRTYRNRVHAGRIGDATISPAPHP